MDERANRRLATLGTVLAFALAAALLGLAVGSWYASGFEAVIAYRLEPVLMADDTDRAALVAGVRDDAVLSDALRALGAAYGNPDELSRLRDRLRVSVQAVAGSDAELWLAVQAPTPWGAVSVVTAVAEAFEAREHDEAEARAAQALAELQVRIDALAEEIRALQVLGGGDERDVSELVDVLGRLTVGRSDLAAAVASGDPPLAIDRVAAVRWRLAPMVLVAAAASTLLGGLLGFVVQRSSPGRGRRIRTADRRPGRGVPQDGVLAVFPPPRRDNDPALFEAADRLRTRLLAATSQARPRVLLVCGVGEADASSAVAGLLAEELAWHGARTLLVDGIIYAPSLATRYAIAEAPDDGADAPRAATTLEWLQHPSGPHRVVSVALDDRHTLDLVPQFRPARPAPGTAETLFAGFGDAVERWQAYDAIVVDAPPLEAVEDGRLLARFATGVVLVTERSPDGRRRSRRLERMVHDAGSRLLGYVEVEREQDPTAPRAQPPATRDRRNGGTFT